MSAHTLESIVPATRAIRAARLAQRVAALTVKAATPKYGCLMAMVPVGELRERLLRFPLVHIPKENLHTEGVETEPHVTVFYGFQLGFKDFNRLSGLRSGSVPMQFTLGAVSRFECPDYDVIKVDIESPEAMRWNTRIGEEFDGQVTPSKWDYHPHLTLAYVQKGTCRDLDGRMDFAREQFTVSQLLYSLPEKAGRQMIQAATPQGHPFRGNQWTTTPHLDPAGKPTGKLRSAVLVINGKRYKGPSHFQALMSWAQQHPEGNGMPNVPESAQGFETESGHFLNRDDAADYALGQGQVKDEDSEHVENTGRLNSEALTFATHKGKLYTMDAIQASKELRAVDDPLRGDLAQQDAARAKAQEIYSEAIGKMVAAAEADAIASRKLEEDEKKRKRRRQAFLALCALLFLGAAKRSYRQLEADLEPLATAAPDDDERQPTPAPDVEPGETEPPTVEPLAPHEREVDSMAPDIDAFAKERAPLLENFPVTVADRVEQAAKDAEQTGGDELAVLDAVHSAGRSIEEKIGKMVAQIEAQATYGTTQFRALVNAGFLSAYWVTMEDDRVRESHDECADAGAVRLGKPFPNGLLYPGDPSGPIEETANCRCVLVGAKRRKSMKGRRYAPQGSLAKQGGDNVQP